MEKQIRGDVQVLAECFELAPEVIVQARVELPKEPFPSMDGATLRFADRMLDTAPYVGYGRFVDGVLSRLSTAAASSQGASAVPQGRDVFIMSTKGCRRDQSCRASRFTPSGARPVDSSVAISSPGLKFRLPLNAMCSRKCASPCCSSVSSTEPALTASWMLTRFSGRPFFRM